METLPSYRELKSCLPLQETDRLFIAGCRQTVRTIINGIDPRLLLIVGPCSIHDSLSAKEYAVKLRELANNVSKEFFILMRGYCEKPRTLIGWKGYLYDPHLNQSNDIKTGIRWTRQLFLELTKLRIPIATEFLDPLTAFYYDDLISWGSIGARTSSSQPHRQLASHLDMAVGIKNGVSGHVSSAIDGVACASHAHTYMGISDCGHPTVVRSHGNKYAHIVLRGGDKGPNFDHLSISETSLHLKKAQCPPCILIDCSHQNSEKRYDKQPFVFQSVIEQIMNGNRNIRGLLMESHLKAGSQSLTENPAHLEYGISITDACLDWHTTEQSILQNAHLLHQNHIKQVKSRHLETTHI